MTTLAGIVTLFSLNLRTMVFFGGLIGGTQLLIYFIYGKLLRPIKMAKGVLFLKPNFLRFRE